MKRKRINILFVATLFFLRLGSADSSAYAQNESQVPLHDELPRADQCSVMTIHIRELALSLKEVMKEKSLLEPPVRPVLENNGDYGQRLHDYEQRMELLQERASSLRKQIDTKEQALIDCLQNNASPQDQKDPQTLQKNGKIE